MSDLLWWGGVLAALVVAARMPCRGVAALWVTAVPVVGFALAWIFC